MTSSESQPAPAIRLDMLDFPTGWAIQRRGLEHLHPKCSAVQTDGAFLCDCGAIEAAWHLLRREAGLEE